MNPHQSAGPSGVQTIIRPEEDPESGEIRLVPRITRQRNSESPASSINFSEFEHLTADSPQNGSNLHFSELPLWNFLNSNVTWHWKRSFNDTGPPTNNIKIPPKEVLPYSTYGMIGRSENTSVWAMQSTEHDEGFKGTMALKICTLSKEYFEQAKSELKNLQGLRHYHIVTLAGTYLTRDTLGIVMYPAAAWDLARYMEQISIENKKTIELEKKYHDIGQPQKQNCHKFVEKLRSFLLCLCQALIYLHELPRPVKHKDIKPANILVEACHNVVLADFGISKKYKDQSQTRTDGPTRHTIRYAPRQVVEGTSRGLEADVFSLGCVFLEIATVVTGQTLENLWEEVFPKLPEAEDRKVRRSYYKNLKAVGDWVEYLKEFRDDRSQPTDSEYLNDEALDSIVSMMSDDPKKRPGLRDLSKIFRKVARTECRSCSSPYPLARTQQITTILGAGEQFGEAGAPPGSEIESLLSTDQNIEANPSYITQGNELTSEQPRLVGAFTPSMALDERHTPSDPDAISTVLESTVISDYDDDRLMSTNMSVHEDDSATSTSEPTAEVANSQVLADLEPEVLNDPTHIEPEDGKYILACYLENSRIRRALLLSPNDIPGEKVIVYDSRPGGSDKARVCSIHDGDIDFKKGILVSIPRFTWNFKIGTREINLARDLGVLSHMKRAASGNIKMIFLQGDSPSLLLRELSFGDFRQEEETVTA